MTTHDHAAGGEPFDQRVWDFNAMSVIAAHLRKEPAEPFSGRQCEEYVLDARDRLYAPPKPPTPSDVAGLVERLKTLPLAWVKEHGDPNGTDYEQGVNDHGYRVGPLFAEAAATLERQSLAGEAMRGALERIARGRNSVTECELIARAALAASQPEGA